jgi:hypothetical protein
MGGKCFFQSPVNLFDGRHRRSVFARLDTAEGFHPDTRLFRQPSLAESRFDPILNNTSGNVLVATMR